MNISIIPLLQVSTTTTEIWWPGILIIAFIAAAAIIYWKTRSLVKVGFLAELILAVFVLLFSIGTDLLISLLALGLLVNGIIGIIKFK